MRHLESINLLLILRLLLRYLRLTELIFEIPLAPVTRCSRWWGWVLPHKRIWPRPRRASEHWRLRLELRLRLRLWRSRIRIKTLR